MKLISKFPLACILCIFIFLLCPLSTVQAKTYVTSGKITKNWTCGQMTNGGYLTMDGDPVFCVEPHIIYKTNQKYEVITARPSYISEAKARKLGLISYYGTKYFQTERHYAATQSLIWIELGESVSSSTFKVDGISVQPEMDEIISYVNTHHMKPSFTDQTYTLNVGQTIEIEDTNQVLERFTIAPIEGLTIEKKENTLYITALPNAKPNINISVIHEGDSKQGTTLFYKIPGTSEGNGWQICGRFYLEEPIYSSFQLNITHYEDPKIEHVQATQTGEDVGTITFIKKDANTLEGLEGAEISILFENEILVSHQKTNKDGIITTSFKKHYKATSDVVEYISNYDKLSPTLQQQYESYFKSYNEAYTYASSQAKKRLNKLITDASYTFTAIEQKPRNGYFLSESSTSMTTKDNNVTLELKNHPITKEIEILKLDEQTKTPIEGVQFGLYAKSDIIHPDGKTGILHKKDELVASFPKTDTQGKTKLTNLYNGDYYLKEMDAPASYVLKTEKINVVHDHMTITNQKTKIALIKLDATTNQPLKDAHLKIVDQNYNTIATWISSSQPYIIEGLRRDETYTLIETKAPEGYQLAKPMTFTLQDGPTILLYNHPVYGEIYFDKKGEVFESFEEGFVLKEIDGSELSIYQNNQLITVLKSNTSTILPYGKYQAKETKAPEGYLIDEATYEFEVTTNQQQTISIINKRPSYAIKLIKQFEDGYNDFSDVSFGIFTQDHQFIASCFLDDQGYLLNLPSLPYGSYYLKEMTTHPNYVLDYTHYPFTIEFQNQPHIEILINDQKPIINRIIPTNKTGDHQMILPIVFLCLASFSMLVYLIIKKRPKPF